MIQCQKCHKSIPQEERAKFCPYCGEVLKGSPSLKSFFKTFKSGLAIAFRPKWVKALTLALLLGVIGAGIYFTLTNQGPKVLIYTNGKNFGVMDGNLEILDDNLQGYKTIGAPNAQGNMLAVDKRGGKYKLINQKGEDLTSNYWSIGFEWRNATERFYSDEYIQRIGLGDAWLSKQSPSGSVNFIEGNDKKWRKSGLLDANGKIIIESDKYIYDSFDGRKITTFASRGNSTSSDSYDYYDGPDVDEFGLIDENGKELLEAEYDYLEVINDEYILLSKHGDQDDAHITDLSGEKVLKQVVNMVSATSSEKHYIFTTPEDLQDTTEALYSGDDYTNSYGVLDQDMQPLLEEAFVYEPAVNEQGYILGVKAENKKDDTKDFELQLYDETGEYLEGIYVDFEPEDDSSLYSYSLTELLINLFPVDGGFIFTSQQSYGFISNEGKVTYEEDTGVETEDESTSFYTYDEDDDSSYNPLQGVVTGTAVEGTNLVLLSIEGDARLLRYDSEQEELIDTDLSNKFMMHYRYFSELLVLETTNSEYTIINRRGDTIAEDVAYIAPAGQDILVQYRNGIAQLINKETGKTLKESKVKLDKEGQLFGFKNN